MRLISGVHVQMDPSSVTSFFKSSSLMVGIAHERIYRRVRHCDKAWPSEQGVTLISLVRYDSLASPTQNQKTKDTKHLFGEFDVLLEEPPVH